MPKAKFRSVSIYSFLVLVFTFALLTSAMAQVNVVNAAHYWPSNHPSGNGGLVAPDGLASAFGVFKVAAGQTSYSASNPYPTTLGGVKLNIGGVDAQLAFVGTGQINFVVPSNVPTGGTQTVTVTNADSTTTTGTVRIEKAMPGIFSANFTGTGVAAANWTPDGSQPYPAVYSYVNGSPVHSNLDAGTTASPSYLILYGTGIRNGADTVSNDPAPGYRNVAESVKVSIGGIPARVDYAGKQGFFTGVDQINVVIPPELASFGILNVVVSVTDGTTYRGGNSVEIKLLKNDNLGNPIYAPVHIVRDLNINGDTASGVLTYGDDLEKDTTSGLLYFSDIYTITTTQANTPITIDLRTDLNAVDQLDTLVIVRKVSADGKTQSFYAADDQGGGYGNNIYEANNNSLLFTVLQDPGQYWIVVTSADVAPLDTGPYTLTVKTNNITPIAYGQTLNGNIAVGDVQTAAGDYVDPFYFTGTEGQTVQATMTSSAFIPCLALRDRNGDEPAVNCPVSGTTATVNFTLPVNSSMPQTRQFVLVGTPLATNITGAYTMRLLKTAGAAEPSPAITEGATETGASRSRADGSNAGRRASSSRAMFRKGIGDPN